MQLLFWERFFLLYFEACAIHADNNFFLAAWKEHLNKHFIKAAQAFDSRGKEKPFYQLYYAFTTWSKDVILTTGSNLFLAQNSELLRLFVHVYPPLFPRRQGAIASAPGEEQTAPRNDQIAAKKYRKRYAVNKLVLELPERVRFDPNAVSDEKSRFLTYKSELRKNIRDLKSTPSSDAILPVLADLSVLLPQYDELSAAMERADSAHMSLLATMWFNEPITMFLEPRSCLRGIYCHGPVSMQIHTTRVAQPPTIQSDVKQNREMFNNIFFNFFSVARYLAHCVAVLSDVTAVLTCGGAAHAQAGQYLFFAVLPFVLQGTLPPYSPLTTHVIRRILLPLGEAFVRNSGVQKRLLHAFLHESKKMAIPLIIVDNASVNTGVAARQPSSHSEVVDLLSSSSSTVASAPGSVLKSAQQMHLESLSASSSAAPLSQSQAVSAATSVASTRFTETRANLYYLFDPSSLLNRSAAAPGGAVALFDLGFSAPAAQLDPSAYLEVLFTLLRAGSDCKLNVDEVKLLCDRLAFEASAEAILNQSAPVHAERLFEALELTTSNSSNPPLQALANILMPKLLRYDFPRNVPRVVKIMLVHSGPSFKPNWDLIADDWLQPELLVTVRNELPLGDDQLISAVQLARRVILSSSMRNALIAQVAQNRFDVSTWGEVKQFIASALQPLRGDSVCAWSREPDARVVSSKSVLRFVDVSVKAFYAVVELLVDVVLCTSTGLVNRIWDLYNELLAPYISSNARSVDVQRVQTLLARLPWRDADFHLTNPEVVVEFSSASELHASVVRLLFCSLDWHAYALRHIHAVPPSSSGSSAAVDLLGDFGYGATVPAAPVAVAESSEPFKSYAGKHVLHFLKLFIELHVASPGAAPAALSSRVFSVSKQPESWYEPRNHIFDWRLVPREEFAQVFDGSVLFRALLKAGPHLTVDPSPQLMECAMLLRDIARMHATSEGIISCLSETRSIMFRVLSALDSDGHNFWFLPPQEHVDLVNNVLIPLCQQFHGIQIRVVDDEIGDDPNPKRVRMYSKVKYDPLALLLSCVRARPGVVSSWDWGEPYLADIRFYNSHTVPRSVRPQIGRGAAAVGPSEVVIKKPRESQADMLKQLETLNDRIYGLISRFCLSADADLCLAILSQAYRGFGPGRLPVLMQVYDETLHAFFSASGDAPDDAEERPMQEALRAIEPPNAPWAEIVDACIACHGALALRVLLEQQRHYLVNIQQPEWLAFMLTAVSCVTRFIPQQHHEFDLFPLWFFLLEIVTDPRWPIPGAAPQADLRIEEILSYLNGFAQEATGFSWLMGGAASGVYKKFDHLHIPSKVEPHMQLAAQFVGSQFP